MSSEIDPAKLKVVELRAELQARGLDVKGNKPVLVKRLKEALEAELQKELPDTSIADTSTEDLNSSQDAGQADTNREVSPVLDIRSAPEHESTPEPEDKTEAEPVPTEEVDKSTTGDVCEKPEEGDVCKKPDGDACTKPENVPEPEDEANPVEEQDDEDKMEETDPISEEKPNDQVNTEEPDENQEQNGDSANGETEEEAEPKKKSRWANAEVREETADESEPMEQTDVEQVETKPEEVPASVEVTEPRGEKRKLSSPSPVRQQQRRRSRSPNNKEDEPTIDTSKTQLSWYDSDLHLLIDKESFLSAKPLNDGALGYVWSGARLSHGVKNGKVCYEVKVVEELKFEDILKIPLKDKRDRGRDRRDRNSRQDKDKKDEDKSKKTEGKDKEDTSVRDKEDATAVKDKEDTAAVADTEETAVKDVDIKQEMEVDGENDDNGNKEKEAEEDSEKIAEVKTEIKMEVDEPSEGQELPVKEIEKSADVKTEVTDESAVKETEESNETEQTAEKETEQTAGKETEKSSENETEQTAEKESADKKTEETTVKKPEESAEKKPETKEEDVHNIPAFLIRIGWSTLESSLQLGEDTNSYGLESSGKFFGNSTFTENDFKIAVGDVVGAYLNINDESITLSFTVNGEEKFTEVLERTDLPEDFTLFPHVITRNLSFELNVGNLEEAWFAHPEALTDYVFINKFEEKIDGPTRPAKRSDCEVIMMCGLPASGKTQWVKEHLEATPEKKYTIIGNSYIYNRMTVDGKPLEESIPKARWNVVTDRLTKSLNRLCEIAALRTRNFILDQTNVFPSAQRRKMRSFWDFKRHAVIVVNQDEEQDRRLKQQESQTGKDVSESTILEMKASMSLPRVGDWLQKVTYASLEDAEAKAQVQKYNTQGREAGFGNRHRDNRDDRGYGGRWGGGGGHGQARKDYRGNYRDNRSYQNNRYGDRGQRQSGGGGGGGGGWRSGSSGGGGGNWGRNDRRDNRGSRDWRNNNRGNDRHRGGSSGGGNRDHRNHGGSGGGNFNRNRNQGGGGRNQGNWNNQASNWNPGQGSGSWGGQGQNPNWNQGWNQGQGSWNQNQWKYGGYGQGGYSQYANWNYYGQYAQNYTQTPESKRSRSTEKDVSNRSLKPERRAKRDKKDDESPRADSKRIRLE